VPQSQPLEPGHAGSPAPEFPSGPLMLSVRQVNELVRGAISRHLPPTLHVLGEIGNLSRPLSGHLYFTLKDPTSELRCVMWRSSAARLRFAPEVGMQVIATGSIEVYTQRGQYQLIVRRLEPRGVGALEIAFRQLKERLEREGLFDPRRKKPLPRIPERVAVVTSPTGAAIRDILHTLRRRFPALDILVYPVRVQGEGAAQEIAAAIRTLNEHAAALGGIDVMIVGRGGGSLEDLWAFNEEVVARAIAGSRIPVVSAVGHEVDVSISDLVADLRAPTPTAAAELITPTLTDLLATLDRQRLRATRTVGQQLELARARLNSTLAYDGLARPFLRLRQQAQFIDELQQRLRLALAHCCRAARQRLNATEGILLRFATGRRFVQAARTLDDRLHRLWRSSSLCLLTAERRLTQGSARLEQHGPAPLLRALQEHIRQVSLRLDTALRAGLAHQRQLLVARVDAIAACDPQRVLRRGYSITRDARTHAVITSISQVSPGARLLTTVSDGDFHSTADDPRQARLFD